MFQGLCYDPDEPSMGETGIRGRFEIVRLIGRGAMGAVYLAEDTVIGRRVALKTVNFDSLQDQPVEEHRPRLGAEARAAGRLSHPNIVAVHDVIENGEGRSLSIAMEYVEGTNLAELLRRGPPPSLETALDLAAQVAEGLAYAHARGVVHRDVKPENLLLTAEGRVKIADFGIAHLIDSALVEDLRFLGTPSYMAPERIRGEEVDQRSDLFSVGVVLYELLTRRLPFEGDTVAAVTRRIASEAFTPLERYLPAAPAAVLAIVRKALDKDPDRRYGSAAEMAADLRRALAAREQLRQTQPVPVIREVAAIEEPVLPRQAAPGQTAPPEPQPAATARPAAARTARGRRSAWVAVGLVGALAAAAALAWRWPRATTAESGPSAAPQASAPVATSQRAGLLRELAARQAAMSGRAARELVVRGHLERARVELAAGRLAAAGAELAAARALEPERAEIAELDRGLADGARALRTAELAAEPPAPIAPAAVVVVEAPPVLRLETAAASDAARLLLDFQSEVPRGALTLYSGGRQIFREGFHFVERTSFLLRRGVAGSFRRTLERPLGDLDLRVYLSLPKRETQVVRVEGQLRGGTTPVLLLRVAADGGFTARLQP